MKLRNTAGFLLHVLSPDFRIDHIDLSLSLKQTGNSYRLAGLPGFSLNPPSISDIPETNPGTGKGALCLAKNVVTVIHF